MASGEASVLKLCQGCPGWLCESSAPWGAGAVPTSRDQGVKCKSLFLSFAFDDSWSCTNLISTLTSPLVLRI